VTTIVAIVPAKDAANTVRATVQALQSGDVVLEILVVDDGSVDDTAVEAAAAGAQVLRLAVNSGKSDAVRHGVDSTPQADIYLLVDADTGDHARGAFALLDPLLRNEADLTIGVLPDSSGRGGLGVVKSFAAWGIARTCGITLAAPLSGQRAVRAPLLRAVGTSHRFGLEVAMTVDAVRAGARVMEVPVEMDHLHRGRGFGGFMHRGRQGVDVVRALAPRMLRAGESSV